MGNTRVRIVDKNANGVVDLDHNDPEVHEITGAYHYYPFAMPARRSRPELVLLNNEQHWRRREFEGAFNPQQEDINRYRYNGKEWGETCGWYACPPEVRTKAGLWGKMPARTTKTGGV